MNPKCLSASLVVLVLAMAASADRARADDGNPAFIQHDTFVGAHPDLYWQRQGIRNYTRGRYAEAMTDFRRAARFADKTSQAMIAQMLWNGDGVKADHVMAYVWADLAAERGYPDFIATREKFWRELGTDEQKAAVAAGQAIFAEYGDQIAKHREERELRLARINITGSRTGHVGTIDMLLKNSDNSLGAPIDGSLYFAPKYWEPKQYWQWRDHTWTQPPEGNVEVGPIQTPPAH